MGTHTGPNEASALWLGRALHAPSAYTATAAVLAVAVLDGVTVGRYLVPCIFRGELDRHARASRAAGAAAVYGLVLKGHFSSDDASQFGLSQFQVEGGGHHTGSIMLWG
jgi:hypothetical protein